MSHIPNLEQVAIVLTMGVLAAVVLGRLRLPATAGLLVAGAFSGPAGLGLVKDLGVIEVLAEVGVVLLLFTIGLELSLARLRRIAKQILVGGSLQVGLTIGVVGGIGAALGLAPGKAVLIGFLVALSSTAIVLRSLSERGELDAPHGRLVLGVLIFQDLCVVPMILIVPFLAGVAGGSPGIAIAYALGKAALVVVGAVVAGRWVLPRIFAWVSRGRSREAFTLAVLATCLGTAWLTSVVGLSLALGAFVAGVLLADSDYGHRAISEVLPLRDLFASIFFMSVGMLFDVRILVTQPLLVGLLLGAFLLGKGALATLAVMAMRFPARVAWLAGVGLAQFGEFGFVLARLGTELGLLTRTENGAILAAGALSMFVTPLAVRAAPHVSAGERLLRPLERLLGARGIDEPAPEHAALSGHVVIAGYGVAGKLLARTLASAGLPYVLLELDADNVRKGRDAGEVIYLGDVTSAEALGHAGFERARALVLLINDRDAAQRAVAAARHLAPSVPIYLRSRYVADRRPLLALGADDVVHEELEAGIEMMARVLRRCGIEEPVIDEQILRARTEAAK